MAYKQNAGRGKSDSYASMISNGLINKPGDPPNKALKKHVESELNKTKTTPTKTSKFGVGSTYTTSKGGSWEVIGMGKDNVTVKSPSGKINSSYPLRQAKKDWVTTLERQSAKRTLDEVRLGDVSNPKKQEGIKKDIRQSAIDTPSPNEQKMMDKAAKDRKQSEKATAESKLPYKSFYK